MSRFTRLPTWAQALLTLGAVLLIISLLPMLASGMNDSEPTSSSSSDGPPSPLPLERERGSDGRGDGKDAKGRDVPSDGEATPRGPLPVAGGSTLPALAVGIALLGGGLGVVRKVGLHGDRGWPGRYVRRIG
jgi:hypothetical protein